MTPRLALGSIASSLARILGHAPRGAPPAAPPGSPSTRTWTAIRSFTRTVQRAIPPALLIAAIAWARSGDELLAPRVSHLEESMTRTTRLLDQARVFQDQLASAQSLFVAEKCSQGGCDPDRAAQLIVDAQYAGHASRDLLQSARAELDRALAISSAETVQPLLDDARREAVDNLRKRTEAATRAWLVRTAWYEDRMAPWAFKLKSKIATTCAREPGSGAEQASP
jgi:hypothetical protein